MMTLASKLLLVTQQSVCQIGVGASKKSLFLFFLFLDKDSFWEVKKPDIKICYFPMMTPASKLLLVTQQSVCQIGVGASKKSIFLFFYF